MRANQPKAVFDQLAISPLAVAKGIACFLPRGGNAFEGRGTGSCARASPGLLAEILFTHGPIERKDYKEGVRSEPLGAATAGARLMRLPAPFHTKFTF